MAVIDDDVGKRARQVDGMAVRLEKMISTCLAPTKMVEAI
jgi:hypothetical protein